MERAYEENGQYKWPFATGHPDPHTHAQTNNQGQATLSCFFLL